MENYFSCADKYPIIFGIAGPELSKDEEAFFSHHPPLGFILFSRNIKSPQQVRQLTLSMRQITAQKEIPILIDEEGGRVSRLAHLGNPYISHKKNFNAHKKNPLMACQSYYENIARSLKDLGITVNCAPVLDIRKPHTAYFLKDRCFSHHAATVSALGHVAIKAMQSLGITPVMKHIPGHGQASHDSHYRLPVMLSHISQDDLLPFQEQSRCCPWAMSSHLLFPKLDKVPVTFSQWIVQHIIRKKIGFSGFLITDDLFMHALSGYDLRDRIEQALTAGHDAVLLCKGKPSQWEKAIKNLNPIPYLKIPR